MSLSLVEASSNGSYHTINICATKINLIAIVASKENTDREEYVRLFKKSKYS